MRETAPSARAAGRITWVVISAHKKIWPSQRTSSRADGSLISVGIFSLSAEPDSSHPSLLRRASGVVTALATAVAAWQAIQ